MRETGVAQPELPKLVKMAEIFEVSLDELVLGKAGEPKTSDLPNDIIKEEKVLPEKDRKPFSVTKLVFGAIFAVLGCLIGNLFLVFAAYGEALAVFIVFGLCAFFCLMQTEHAALWCFDTWFVFILLYFNYATGLSWELVFNPLCWDIVFNPLFYAEGFTVQIIMPFIEIALVIGMFIMQIVAFRKKKFAFSLKKNIALAIFTVITLALNIAAGFLFPAFWMQIVAGGDKQRYYEIYRNFQDFMTGFEFTVEVALLIAFTACLVPTFYWIKSLITARKRKKTEK